jgi:hypothetical protein
MSKTKDDNLILALDTTNAYYIRANATLKLDPTEHAKELRTLSNDTSHHVRHSAIAVMDTKTEKHLLETVYAFDDDYDVRLLARRNLAKIGVILPKEHVPM